MTARSAHLSLPTSGPTSTRWRAWQPPPSYNWWERRSGSPRAQARAR